MTDQIDRANDYADAERAMAIANRLPVDMAKGAPGECDFCGEWFGRLVDGACVPCRDKYQPKNMR